MTEVDKNCSYYKDIVKDENKMTEEITEAIRNAFNEYLNVVDKMILENQALQIELQHLKQENFALTQESQQKSQTICDLKQENENDKKLYTECMHYLACMTEQRNKLKLALEEIRDAWQGGVYNNGINGNYRPIKNTTKEDCYNALGKIQKILSEVL